MKRSPTIQRIYDLVSEHVSVLASGKEIFYVVKIDFFSGYGGVGLFATMVFLKPKVKFHTQF